MYEDSDERLGRPQLSFLWLGRLQLSLPWHSFFNQCSLLLSAKLGVGKAKWNRKQCLLIYYFPFKISMVGGGVLSWEIDHQQAY